ncbi:MAG: extracellular solute-binding protein [Dehalococcoidia bacterium]|nr:extracellular solute-binding protein [Dehalococcoidia bacterium]
MKRLITSLILIGLVLTGCSKSTVAPPPPVTAPTAPQITQKPAWETQWETTVAEAKKEGKVVVYTLWSSAARGALTTGFKNKYGIDVEFTPFSRGSDFIAKIQAEQRAGLYLADVFGAGATTLISTMKPAGLLGDVEPILILPEVKDPKVWRDNKFPYLDEGRTTIGIIGMVLPTLVVNNTMIKDGEITSVKDILKPEYKDKITLNDPTVPGSGNAIIAMMADWLWNEQEAMDFLKALLKNGAVVERDNRTGVEWVARGKYPIGVGPHTESLAQFISMGSPLSIPNIKEPPNGTASSGGLAIPTKFANPNAAKVFMNWMLSKEGQSIFATTYLNPSRRIDASTEGIDPIFIPKPGQKIFWDEERTIKGKGRIMAATKAIIEAAQ